MKSLLIKDAIMRKTIFLNFLVLVLVFICSCNNPKSMPSGYYDCNEQVFTPDSSQYMQISFDCDSIYVSIYKASNGEQQKTIRGHLINYSTNNDITEADAVFNINGKEITDHLKFEATGELTEPTEGGICISSSTGNIIPNEYLQFKEIDMY